MSGYSSMLQEVVEGLSRRGHSIEDRGPDWILVEDEDGRQFNIHVIAAPVVGSQESTGATDGAEQ